MNYLCLVVLEQTLQNLTDLRYFSSYMNINRFPNNFPEAFKKTEELHVYKLLVGTKDYSGEE